ALGYASWEKGQLEQEILDNAWLTAPADLNILFKTPIADRCIAKHHARGWLMQA
ncbi:YqgE/AlgH family protein, partial [Escherichia coli]